MIFRKYFRSNSYMNFIPLLVSSITILSINSLGDRYQILPDPHDTNYWYDAQPLSADTPYQSVFKDPNDDDYYTFTATNLRSFAVKVTSTSQIASISVFKNNTSNLVAHYNSNVAYNYASFSSNLVSIGPNETIFIQVIPSVTSSYYTIWIDSNPNLSGVSILKANGNEEPLTYYGSANLTQINYYVDSSCNITFGSYSFANAYLDALNEWNKVGNLNLNIVNNASYADVILSTDSVINLYPDIGKTQYTFVQHLIGLNTYYDFYASSIRVVGDWYFYGSNYSNAYEALVKTCIHEVGHSIGLGHSNYNTNYMYGSSLTGIPGTSNYIGDGDVSSYLYIYG